MHYGHASLAPAAALPAYYVFGRDPVHVPACCATILQYCRTSENLKGCPGLVVVLDQPLLHAAQQLQALLDDGGVQVSTRLSMRLACESAGCW